VGKDGTIIIYVGGKSKRMKELKYEIEYKQNEKINALNKLFTANGGVGIYGAGDEAGRMIRILYERYGIKIECCVVDDKFYKNGQCCEGVSCYSVSNSIVTELAIVLLGFRVEWADIEAVEVKMRRIFPSAELITIFDIGDTMEFDLLRLDYYYFLEHYRKFSWAYDNLKDELSKEIFVAYLEGHINGNSRKMEKYRSEKREDYDYELLFKGRENKLVVECGAYDGESALQALTCIKENDCEFWAFEPDSDNYLKLQSRIVEDHRIKPFKYGTYDEDGTLYFISSGSSSYMTLEKPEDECFEVPVCSLDNKIKDRVVTSIIMDVEGSELKTLMGAKKSIVRDRPSLAIRVYHKVDDLITIPQFLDSIMPEEKKYDFYLRNHFFHRGLIETTLYAI